MLNYEIKNNHNKKVKRLWAVRTSPHLEGFRLSSSFGCQLSQMRSCMVFISSSSTRLGLYHKIGHCQLILHPSWLIILTVFWQHMKYLKYQWVVKWTCGPDGSEKQAGEVWTTGRTASTKRSLLTWHPRPRRDSNPQSQQASGHRLLP